MFSELTRRLLPSHTREKHSSPKRIRLLKRLAIEELECRLAPATHYWVGGVAPNTWTTALDWKDGQVPLPGDTLIFDSQAKTDSTYDGGLGSQIASVKINPGFGKHSVNINAPLTITSTLVLNDQPGKLVTNVMGRWIRNIPTGTPGSWTSKW